MSSPYPPSIPRSTLPLPTRRNPLTGLRQPPHTHTQAGSVTSATSRPGTHGQPDPGQIELGLQEMLKGLEGLEEVLKGVFDGVENAFDPTSNPGQTQAINTIRALLGVGMSTSLGGVPLVDDVGSTAGTMMNTDHTSTQPPLPTLPLSTSTSTSTSTLTLTDLAARIEKASGESYARGKVLRDEVRGVGEVLGRR